MPLTLKINARIREFEELNAGSNLHELLEVLSLKSDRVALELNGLIVPRTSWGDRQLAANDSIELVHFVGGG